MKIGSGAVYSAVCMVALAACSSGGGGTTSTPVTPVANQPPVMSSPAAVTLDENAQGVIHTVQASDSDGSISSYSIVAGGDEDLFSFDTRTGELSLDQWLLFDTPADLNTDNVYELTFVAEDNDGATVQQSFALTIEEAELKARLKPSENFELIDWRLELPVNEDGEPTGRNDTIQESELASGYEGEYFYTGPDGGMVFRTPIGGATTPNSSYSRTELREMLRRGNTSISARPSNDIPNANNWAFSSQPAAAQVNAGGVDGVLRVSLAVNSVTETGSSSQVGRMIIGQIHAKDDEPIRLYYRKLPGNENGVVYAEHELAGGDDIRFDIVGDSSNDASNPANGFALDERFTYEIVANGNLLTANVYDEAGTRIGFTDIDMTNSGYDVLDDWMYFKAGLYHVNSTADDGEVAQLTIYELTNTHDGYPF